MKQHFPLEAFELVIVDDGSTDGTDQLVRALATETQDKGLGWQYHWQANQGRSHARNVGIGLARGELVVFIDSDVVVVPGFLAEHVRLHDLNASRKVFVQGLAVNTDRFEDPLSTPVKPTDVSAAFFATNNVSVAKALLVEAGGFDEGFTEYGWEDLELGLRLKALGVGIVRTRVARGFHWHPAFTLMDLPALKRIEEQRGRMAAYFYRKHPTLDVRLMIQLTAFHQALGWVVTLGGAVNEVSIVPVLTWLLSRGRPALAQQVATAVLNQYNLAELQRALAGEEVVDQAAVRG